MCGICGFFGFEDNALLRRMTKAISHRGPGRPAFFSDKNVSLGYQRLSIIDLESGRSLIHNEDESMWISYNGELYNYQELREELEKKGHSFYTERDTEVVLHAYEEYGVDCLARFNGCYAFGIWDGVRKKLFLARDRMGIKPLYYTNVGNEFLFASEIKSILEYPKVKREVNTKALNNYLAFRYVSGPDTMFRGIFKLPPAHYLFVGEGPKPYWDSQLKPAKGNFKDQILQILGDSVKIRLMSDVPLGAFLSGGIDSSLIVSLMAEEVENLKTFSIGFGSEDVDELKYARFTAENFSTDHHEFIVESKEVKRLPQILWHLDEPISDATTIPVYLLSELAKKHVTVVLSGEGADELFAGYMQFQALYKMRHLHLAPKPARFLGAKAASKMPIAFLDKFFEYQGSIGEVGHKRLQDSIAKSSLGNAYLNLISQFTNDEKKELFGSGTPVEVPANNINDLLYFEQKKWLPSYMLEKVDKLTLAHALELRVPFLDHRMVELANRIPLRQKLNKDSKYILRRAASKKLPQKTVERKKHAFYTPIDQWFDENLREIMLNLLSEKNLAARGYFEPKYVKKLMETHHRSRLIRSRQLWGLMAFEIWHRIYIDGIKKFNTLDDILG